MASNGNGNHTGRTPDVEANEESPLVESDASVGASSQESSLWDEMDRPWPATFDRSISLLSSPIIKAEEVIHFTRSPKPGNTPLAERRRMVRRINLYTSISSDSCSHVLIFHCSGSQKPQMEIFCPLCHATNRWMEEQALPPATLAVAILSR